MKPQIYGIIGHPLGHSLSPTLHNHWFCECGFQNKLYCSWPIPPDKLDDFVRSVRLLPISGASVTIPHKETITPYLDELSPAARQVGAVNTLYWRGDSLAGENTDVSGFMAPLRAGGESINSALVLGAGGASRAVIHGLKELGIKTAICNRSQDKAEAMAKDMKTDVIPWEKRHSAQADLLVNTTPLGMRGDKTGGKTPWEKDMRRIKTVYDIIYNPPCTPLLKQAEEEGKSIISGLEMFVGQAREQFRIWTGQKMDSEPALAFLGRNLRKE